MITVDEAMYIADDRKDNGVFIDASDDAAIALAAEVRRLREENERLRNNVLVLGDNQQPVAEYDGVKFSRYTLRWINGVMPVGTKLYAPPVFDVQAEKNRHDAEELEALHMNLRDNNVPTHDENGEPFSAWGRVLWFAEKRNAMPVRYVSLQHIKTKVTEANPNPVQVNVISERNGAWLDMPREKIDVMRTEMQSAIDAARGCSSQVRNRG